MLPRGPAELEDMGVDGLSLVGAGDSFKGVKVDPTLAGGSDAPSAAGSSSHGSEGRDGFGRGSESAWAEGRDLDFGFYG